MLGSNAKLSIATFDSIHIDCGLIPYTTTYKIAII
jgi:hypothetical protein